MEMFLSAAAVTISLISLGVSFIVALRDNAKLKAECSVFRHEETGEFSYLQIKAANVGRRPITLLNLMGVYSGGRVCGQRVGDGGKTLCEGDFLEEKIGKFDGMVVCSTPYDDVFLDLKDLYFEDTSGKHHTIIGARQSIEKIARSNHLFGIRTHYE